MERNYLKGYKIINYISSDIDKEITDFRLQ